MGESKGGGSNGGGDIGYCWFDEVVVELGEWEIGRVIWHVNKKMEKLGVGSTIVGRGRGRELAWEDSFIGQCAEAAGSKLITGDIGLYERTRELRERYPYNGDGGCDLIGYRVDFKGHRDRVVREGSEHELWVRPREYRVDRVYVLCLVKQGKKVRVRFIGKAKGRELRKEVLADGSIRWGLRASELHKLDVSKLRIKGNNIS